MLFSSCGFGLSSCSSRALEHRLSSAVGAWWLWGMQDLPEPGIESVSPALAGRFFTIEPRGTSSSSLSFVLSASVIWPYFNGIQIRPPSSMLLKCTDSFEIKLLWKQCKKKALTLLCPHECQKYIYHGKIPYLHQKDVRHREYEIRNSRPRKLYKQISFVISIVCCPKQNPLCFVKFSQIFFVLQV